MLERKRDRINVTKSYLFERITFYQPLERKKEKASQREEEEKSGREGGKENVTESFF